jgi:hypothetical protein
VVSPFLELKRLQLIVKANCPVYKIDFCLNQVPLISIGIPSVAIVFRSLSNVIDATDM